MRIVSSLRRVRWLRLLRNTFYTAAFMAMAGYSLSATAPPLPYFTTPLDPGNMTNTFNAWMQTVNNALQLNFNNGTEPGEMAFGPSATQSFAHNASVATTMTSLGPEGSHTTVQEWMVVVNPQGFIRFIPAY